MAMQNELEEVYKEDLKRGYSSEHGYSYKRLYPGQTKPLPSQTIDEYDDINKSSRKSQDAVLKKGVQYLATHLPQGPNPIGSYVERLLLGRIARSGKTPDQFKEDLDAEKLEEKYEQAAKAEARKTVKKASGGKVKSYSNGGVTRADGCAQRGKTKGRMV